MQLARELAVPIASPGPFCRPWQAGKCPAQPCQVTRTGLETPDSEGPPLGSWAAVTVLWTRRDTDLRDGGVDLTGMISVYGGGEN